MHPTDPLHRGSIEFGSAVLNDIAWLYSVSYEATFKVKTTQFEARFARFEARIVASPWFDGEEFSLVDAVFRPVFRYFDVFDGIGDFGILIGKPKPSVGERRWRRGHQ